MRQCGKEPPARSPPKTNQKWLKMSRQSVFTGQSVHDHALDEIDDPSVILEGVCGYCGDLYYGQHRCPQIAYDSYQRDPRGDQR